MTHTPSDESLSPKTTSLPQLSGKGWALLLGGALLLVGGAWGVGQLIHPAQDTGMVAAETAGEGAIAVETLTVQAQSQASTLDLSGTLRPLEQAVLSTRVTGRITQLALETGDRFQKGDVLARIDVVDMTAQTSQAQSGVAQAQAELARSQATLSQLQAQRLEVQATLRLAEINQGRMAQLQAQGAISQAQLDEANTQLEAARSRLAQINAGIVQAQAAVSQSQAAIDQAQSGVTAATVNESYGDVIAPFDGVVVQKLAYEGEMAAPGAALLKIENPNRLQLEISVPEANLRFAQVGQPVQVRVDAVNQTFSAAIQQIVPAADPNSRSFLVKIPLQNSGRLISGMFGRIALPLGDQPKSIRIPTSALIQRGQLEGVFVVDAEAAEPTALLRWVKTGKQQDGLVEIVSGLSAGDRIITSNLAQLSDGQRVELGQ